MPNHLHVCTLLNAPAADVIWDGGKWLARRVGGGAPPMGREKRYPTIHTEGLAASAALFPRAQTNTHTRRAIRSTMADDRPPRGLCSAAALT